MVDWIKEFCGGVAQMAVMAVFAAIGLGPWIVGMWAAVDNDNVLLFVAALIIPPVGWFYGLITLL